VLEAWPNRRYLTFLLLAAGKELEVEQILQLSQKHLEKLRAENAANPETWWRLAASLCVRGQLLALTKRPEEAAAATESCIALVRKRPAFFRGEGHSGYHFEGPTDFLLELLNRSRRYPEVEIIRRQMIDFYDRLAGLDADNPDFLAYEIRHLLSLASWLRSRARAEAAEQLLPRALDCYRRLTARFPDFHERAQLALLLDEQLRDTGQRP